jgi:hypothetical protein
MRIYARRRQDYDGVDGRNPALLREKLSIFGMSLEEMSFATLIERGLG